MKPTKSKKTTYWRCVIRNKNINCRASVIQQKDSPDDYVRGVYDHCCQPKANEQLKREVTKKVWSNQVSFIYTALFASITLYLQISLYLCSKLYESSSGHIQAISAIFINRTVIGAIQQHRQYLILSTFNITSSLAIPQILL